MPSAARTGAHRLHPCGQSHTPPRRAQIIDAFTSTKFQNWIKGTRDKHSKEPVLAFMDMKMKDKKEDEKGNEVEYTPAGSNALIYLSKLVPTIIWSIIQLGIVLVFAGIYMRFPCYDFVVPDEDTSCTGGYQEPTSTLCAAPPAAPLPSARRDPLPPIQEIRDCAVVLDCHDDDGRVRCARRPARVRGCV